MLTDQLPPTTLQAFLLFAQGRGTEAEEMLLRAAAEAERCHGPESMEYMEAYNALAVVYDKAGQYDRAAEAWSRACAADNPADDTHARNRLTYLNEWAEVLRKAGRLAEAERVLREGLRGRARYYGKAHAGYAFGLEPLAEVLYQSGKAAEALAVLDEAVRNFAAHQHPRHASARALRIWVARAAGVPASALAPLDGLSDEAVQAVLQHAGQRIAAEPGRPEDRAVAHDLADLVRRRFGGRHALLVSALSFIQLVERRAGNHEARLAPLGEMRDILEGLGDARQALYVLVNLAEARDEAGRPGEAERAFREAADRADRLGAALERAWVHDRYGAFLGRAGRPVEAEAVLREALAPAREAGDPGLLGQVLVSLGIVVQHPGNRERAREYLKEGIGLLPPGHGYYLPARSHLNAVESGDPGGCGNSSRTIEEAFREHILAKLPPDCRPDFEVKIIDNRLTVKVEAGPGLKWDQVEHFERIVQHARSEFQRQVLGGGHP